MTEFSGITKMFTANYNVIQLNHKMPEMHNRHGKGQ